jgi:hypothetical protein
MILSKPKLLILSSLLLLSQVGFSATKSMHAFKDNSDVPPQDLVAPSPEGVFLTDLEIEKLSANFGDESKRRPAGSTVAGTEDMLSREYIQFRNELLKARTGNDFYSLIKKYDEMYDKLPASANDLKFTIARMATWLPLKGIIWRMTPMVHQVAPTQGALLATLKNFAEQTKINMPNSHAEAQLLFLSMPTADLVGKEMHVESDFITFLATDVYKALEKSAQRLQTIQMFNTNGREKTPLLFDGKIRFGENSFNDNYDDYERFKVVGEAERFAALARTHRRMYSVAVMAAYNWNGHLAVKREIGKMFGIGIAESALFDALPGEDDAFLRGVSREARVNAIKQHAKLYTLQTNGQTWMNLAYLHLHNSGFYLEKTWENIKNNTNGYAAQLDPDMFMARKEQVEVGIMNIKKLVGPYGKGVNGQTRINGTLSGDELTINIKAFYESAPKDLKALLPTTFSKHEDLSKLKKVPDFKSLAEVKPGSDVLQLKFDGVNKPVRFRNYLYGRSIGWNPKAYATLFPGLKNPQDVANAMRILNETRGSKLLSGGLTMFVR